AFGGGAGPAGAPDRGADVLDLVDLFQQAAEARFRPDVLRRLELDRRAIEEGAGAPRHLGADRTAPAPAGDRARERGLRRREPVAGGVGPSQGPTQDDALRT